jgi:hypothetical protein
MHPMSFTADFSHPIDPAKAGVAYLIGVNTQMPDTKKGTETGSPGSASVPGGGIF